MLPQRYDELAEILSMGQNGRWRRAMVDRIVAASPGTVLDVASGTAGVALQMVARTPADVVGLDLTQTMLARGQSNIAAAGLNGRIQLVAGRGEQLPFPDGAFDSLTFTYLLRYVDDRGATMRELARVIKPGGRIGMVEFGVPASAPLRAAWRVHTRVGLPLLGRAVSPAWVEVGRFLGPNIEELHAREPDLERLWRGAGLAEVRLRHMSFGAGLVMSGRRNGDGQRAA
jgi:demethylmenaquinone methyltransferase/2-methoxy-6-polyprenyl-1,4-benzoquinol methylase